VSTAGILNGWLLITGRLPFAASRDGIAPRWLGTLHPRFGTPVVGIVASTVPAALLVLLYFDRTLLAAYDFIALAATATALVAIAGACLAHLVLLRREPERFPASARARGPALATIGLLIAGIMVAGSGQEVLAATALVVALPLPFHAWGRLGRRRR
jgi:amino acid transporter